MNKLLLIALGGAVGTLLRYGLQLWLNAEGGLPIGTLAVNVLGCLMIGLLAGAWSIEPVNLREEYRLAILVGLLGGFTTFSAFGLETHRLLDTGRLFHAFLNITLSLTAAIMATWAGARVAGWIYAR